MLERLAGHLLQATEAIADEQKTLDLAHRQELIPRAGAWIYIPVIVTNARLNVCSFDATAVDLSEGLLPTNATFQSASVVRFFKNLSSDIDPNIQKDLTETNRAKNRTVFIVNAAGLATFLKDFTWVEGLPDGLRPFVA
jgi:hypothetical protein